jgi:salicylate hydroxylase
MIRAAVVGGGLGGLSTAFALVQAGCEVDVYEQASAFGEVGAGIGLFPNALRVLRSLGIGGELERRGFRQTRLDVRRWDDGRILDSARLDTAYGNGFSNLTFHRADLVDLLRGHLPADTVRLGRQVVGVTQDPDRCTLTFGDGAEAHADVVIGADGIRSRVAAASGLAGRLRPSGYAAYRALVPAERLAGLGLDESMGIWLGPERHLAHYWIAGGSLLNVIGYVPCDGGDAPWSRQGDPDDARAQYRAWHPTVRGILDAVDAVMLFSLFEREAGEQWTTGRVALVGDAAHPMLPFFAQGGGQAIEDAATLGVLLRGVDPEHVAQRLELLSSFRVDRVRRVQAIARSYARANNLADGPEQRERDARLADPAGNAFAASAWLYEHDAEAAAVHELSQLDRL